MAVVDIEPPEQKEYTKCIRRYISFPILQSPIQLVNNAQTYQYAKPRRQMMSKKEAMKLFKEWKKELLHMDIKDAYKARHKYGLEDTLEIVVPKPYKCTFEFTPREERRSSRFTHTLRLVS